ncbi:hypothetical protein GCM10009789_40680 [Kribbella sancticallisti]|uniref:Uncharacterized protein n=1 Tax=Kribbella sancticallisti TaxID=460087 RepID=A0ABP4PJU2_9ACTN
MSTPTGDDFLHGLEIEVETELAMDVADRPGEPGTQPVSEWLMDPAEYERDEIAHRSLLGAVQALEDHPGEPTGTI